MRLAIGLVATLALAGCTPEESPTPSPSPTVAAPSPTVSSSPLPTMESPSPSPTPSPSAFQSYPADLPTEDPVSAAIIQGWQEYQRVLRKFSADPQGFTDFTETQYVTTGEKSVGIIEQLEGYRQRGIKVIGDFKYEQVEVTAPTAGPDGLRQATVSYCLDRSGMKILDSNGEESPTAHLTPTYPESATLVEGRDGMWRVSQVRNDQTQTC